MNNKSSGGIGILGVLFIIFLVLKLTNLIDWSWGAVLIPVWITIGLAIVILILDVIDRRMGP